MKRLTAMFLLIAQLATASEISAHWRDLAAMVTGKDIIVDTAGGDHIRGVALTVESNSMTLQTRKRGRQPVARTDVRDIRVARKSSYKWRTIGAAIGAGTGAAIAIPVLAETHNEGSDNYDAAAVGVVAGLAIIGFVVGWQADRARDLVRILPD
jgi:peptidoglycan/LPS O-acetylase OafA/YrhL